ncbi:TolC family protein [Helicobacter sp. 14348-15]|uniref:TolC family protein n=1 Tax=Helicobacter TaxID=209 RepID=UPI00202B9E56|nr:MULTISPECIES: TolC family protein [Helicobacter]MCL9820308.1 TolC family protein [Helicobacter colisuis]MDY5616197.1 TolC family protein [Helicobacter sp.]
MSLKTLFSLCFFISFGYSLTLQEAIDLTLKANHTIKEQEFLLQEAQYNYKTYQSPFYPSINATYSTDRTNRISSQRTRKTSGNLGANIQLNLFNGLSDYYNLASYKSLSKAQEHQLQATKEDIILLVKTAYIDVLRQKQNVIVAEQSKALLEEQRRESAEFYRVGLIPKNDLLEVEVELNNSIQTLLSAKSNLAYSLKNLERYTRTKINLKDLVELRLHQPTLIESTLKNLMYQKRSELLFLDSVIQSKDYLVKSAKGNFLPNINVIGDYMRYGEDYKLTKRTNKYNDETMITLQINLNLFNGFNDKYTLESTKVNKLAFESQRITLLEDLDLQLFSALETYNLSLNAYKVALSALAQAEENYRISQNRYKERIQSTSDFLDAEYLLTQARTNVVLNRYAILQALAEIERITQTPQVTN